MNRIPYYMLPSAYSTCRKLTRPQNPGAAWPLQDIAIANIVWCMAYKRGVGGGGVYCAMGVQ